MAGVRYQSDFRSLNGTPYRLQIWDINYTGVVGDFNVTAGSLETSFDATGEQKLTEIICSNLSFEFVVEDAAQETFVEYLRSLTIQEKDIYISLWNGTTGSYICQWSGYMLLDLGELIDESFPYGQVMTGVDGLALLKDIDFVYQPSLNNPPYVESDTFMYAPNTPSNNKYAKYIQWITEILGNAGFGGATQGLPAYRISTSVNWYNLQHGSIAGTLTNQDPLDITQCNGFQFYKQTGTSAAGVLYYKPKNCYQALQMICRAWGMRCVMYNQTIYFIQISNYQTPESGSIAAPVNMQSFIYSDAGAFISLYQYLGGNSTSRYTLDIENSTAATGGVQKLAGSTWGEYPVVKEVSTVFPSISNYNAFTGFPLIVGQQVVPHTWPPFGSGTGASLTGGEWEEVTTSLGVFNDAYLLDGFYMMISLQFMNASPSSVKFQMAWTVRAKPSSSATWSSADGLVATNSYNNSTNAWELYWEPLTTAADLNVEAAGTPTFDGRFANSFGSTLGGAVDDQIFFKNVTCATGSSTVDIIAGTEVGNNGNLMPPHPLMQGDWDFELINLSHGPTLNYDAGKCDFHGAVKKSVWAPPGAAPCWENITNDPTGLYQPPNNVWGVGYNTWYLNSGQSLNLSMFSPVTGGAIGSSSYNTQYYTATNDSYILEIKDTFWGDTDTPDVPGSLKVWNGTNWVFSDYLGKWGIGVSTGGNSFTEQLCSDALNMQSTPTQKGNYVLALSSTNKNLSANPLYPKTVNPIGIVIDKLTDYRYVPMKITNNIGMDEVSGMWFQFYWNVVAGNVIVFPNDDNGGPVDDDGNGAGAISGGTSGQARMGGGGSAQASMRLSQLIQPVLEVSEFKQNNVMFNSLSIASTGYSNDNILKTGDVLILESTGGSVELTLAADFEPVTAGSPSSKVYFQDVTLAYNITPLSSIWIDQPELYNQAIRQTRGTMAGFTIDADGMEKDGIEITGWLDDDTFATASVNTLATSESIKAYIDSLTRAQNYSLVVCENTTTSSATDGEANAVVIRYDVEQLASTVNTITLNGSAGVSPTTNGEYSFSLGTTGDYLLQWNVSTNTNIANNRIVSGVKLQSGTIDGELITWVDVSPTHSYIYNRGTGSMRQGSTSNSLLISHVSRLNITYYRLVIWKESSSTATTNVITLLNGTDLIIKQID
mgnify:CR=1 FL=1|tara:strand:- start:8059 stop:11550 length:3492 start_codon:yes stop_codon:yes gene_type:complete